MIPTLACLSGPFVNTDFLLLMKRGSDLVDIIVDIHQSDVPLRTLRCMRSQYSLSFFD